MVKKNGLFYAVLASVLWAIVNPVIKTGLSYDMSPMNFAGLRFTSVGIILLAYTWHKGMFAEIKKYKDLFLLLTFVNIFLGCFFNNNGNYSFCKYYFKPYNDNTR